MDKMWVWAWGIYIILGMLDKDLSGVLSRNPIGFRPREGGVKDNNDYIPTSLAQYSLLGFP